jgi:hypothetical protein
LTKQRRLYRVKFQEPGEKASTVVVVEKVGPSDLPGMVALEGFVFFDQTRFVVLPDEDETRKRFGKTERLYLPYHVLLSIEEFLEDETDLKSLPFIREVPTSP